MKTKTEQIVLATLYGGSVRCVEWNDYREKDKDWIRSSEIVEVTFALLPDEEVVPLKIAAIDEAMDLVRAETLTKIKYLEDEKAKLMAITHEVAE